MKRQLMTLALACASTALFAADLKAQAYRITTKIPFAFTVGDRTCPAGVYDLQAGSFANFEALHNVSGQCSLFVNGKRFLIEHAGRPRLVFHRYGQSYFLSKIWNGIGTGSAIPESMREKHLREATPPSEVATTVVTGINGQ